MSVLLTLCVVLLPLATPGRGARRWEPCTGKGVQRWEPGGLLLPSNMIQVSCAPRTGSCGPGRGGEDEREQETGNDNRNAALSL